MANITKQYKMNLFEPSINSNKVWIGRAFDDGTFQTEWGRVLEGGQLASKTKTFGNQSEAETVLEVKRQEKLRKGYVDTKVLEGETVISATNPESLQKIAARDIVGADDRTTMELIKYLAEVNIHNITSSTSIRFNASNATFTTPLGVLAPDAIQEARKILNEIKDLNAVNSPGFRNGKVRQYFQIVPHDFGRKIPDSSELLSTNRLIEKECDILDALESALATVQKSDAPTDKLFKCRLTKIPHWTDEGKAEFRRIKRLFESTKNAHHGSTANLKLVRIYEVEIENMKEAFDRVAARIGNIKSDLWHGTKASNLLSILKNGLIIPPASAAHCTGRMFGNGIYSSLQSTKALNYATNMWNRSGAQIQRRFMFLCDAALGKTFKPQSSAMQFPAPGSDSTWVEAGRAGVLNHECIVYDVSQINLRYLCEFGDAD